MKIQILTLAALAIAVPSFAQDKAPGHKQGGKMMTRTNGSPMMSSMSKEEMAAMKQMWTKMSSDERKAMGMAMRNMMGAGKMDDKAMKERATMGMTDAQKKAVAAHWKKMTKVEQSAMKKMFMNAANMKMNGMRPSSSTMGGKKAG